MSVSYTASYKIESKETSLMPVLIFSLLFHVFIFFVVPIATRMLRRPKTFERPQTFQLVRIPPKTAPVKQRVIDRPKVKKKAVPKKPVPRTKKDTRPVQKKEELEELSELEDVIGAIQQPVSQISLGQPFKYQWYKYAIRAKVESYWKPPFKDDKIAVVLSFTIFRNGNISEVKVKNSSGNTMLDNLAIRAVKLAAPFGKLPHGESKLIIDEWVLRPTTLE